MNPLASVSGTLLALVAVTSADAGITTTSSLAGYQNAIAGRGYDNADFVAASIAAASGGSGWNAWTASAPGGLYTSSGLLSTAQADAALTISFGSGAVGAVGGTFYLTDASHSAVLASLIEITLDNGEIYVSESSSKNFAGFVADAGQHISSITIKPFTAIGVEYAAVSSMVVSGVPAPGSLALLGAAGFAARRRRR